MEKNEQKLPNRKYKDSVFTDLFQNHPENFLSLYNAIHDTNLKLKDVNLVSERLDNSLYQSTYNDVSMLLNGRCIILIEHQSTINENLPVRLLDYVSKIYEKMIPNDKRYSKNVFYLPEPEFYIFYNGTDPYPDEKILKLSDAFICKTHKPQLELEVTVYNIYNPTTERSLQILRKCSIIKQYCDCVDIIRKVYKRDNPDSYRDAISECLKKGLLGEYLIQAAKENHNMLFCEYDYETDIRVQREESFIAGEKKKAEEDAKGFIKLGKLPLEDIAAVINLPLERVVELADQVRSEG